MNLYAQRMWTIWHDCGQNMEVKLPKARIFQPKECARKIHPILGCNLRAHGFGWKIRNNGSWAPIFCRQASILVCNWGTYHLLVCDHTKIDAKPIFGSLDQCQNMALILEPPEIGEASIFACTNTNAWHISLLYIIRLDWLQNIVCK